MSPSPGLLDVLSEHGVPFVVIGGHAVNLHGVLRATEDTDLLWLRRLKQASGRPKDLLGLEPLPTDS